MSRVLIKQVPDKEPNHDGEWVEREADEDKLRGKLHEVYGYLTSLCDEGHHCVMMNRVPDPEKHMRIERQLRGQDG